MPCDPTQFGETKAERRPSRQGFRIFVHPSGQSHWIWKFQAELLHGQQRSVEERFHQLANHVRTPSTPEGAHGALMDFFGVTREESGTNQFPVEPAHGRSVTGEKGMTSEPQRQTPNAKRSVLRWERLGFGAGDGKHRWCDHSPCWPQRCAGSGKWPAPITASYSGTCRISGKTHAESRCQW